MKHASLAVALVAVALGAAGSQPAGTQEGLKIETLQVAYQGEISAMWKYRTYAEVARLEGHPEAALYFIAISHAESIHAAMIRRLVVERDGVPRSYIQGFQLGTTAENLEASALGEHEEWVSVYPVLKEFAQHKGDHTAADVFRYAGSAEQTHEGLFVDAHGCLGGNPCKPRTPVFLCGECGRAFLERPKVNCPCGPASRRILVFE